MTETLTADGLVEVEAIKRLKYRYLRCLDQKLWDQVPDLFVPEATASYGGGAYTFDNRDEIVAFLVDAMGSEGFLSSHRCGHPEIDLTGPGHAHGVWALDDTVVHTDFNMTIRGAAFYEDDYVKGDDGAWRILHTGYKRTYEEIEPRADTTRLTASWWATDGRSRLGG